MDLTSAKAWSRLGLATALGLGVGLFAPALLFDRVSQELIALAGLMMAAVLPTLMLTATALRSGAFSVRRVLAYKSALTRQAELWAGLFVLALILCAFIIVGRAYLWRYADDPHLRASPHQVIIARALSGAVAALGSFLILRARSVFVGVVSLIDLSAEFAIEEARMRVDDEVNRQKLVLNSHDEQAGYGDYIDLAG